MEQIKQYIMKHFEKLLVALIFIVAFFGTYFIEEVSLIFTSIISLSSSQVIFWVAESGS